MNTIPLLLLLPVTALPVTATEMFHPNTGNVLPTYSTDHFGPDQSGAETTDPEPFATPEAPPVDDSALPDEEDHGDSGTRPSEEGTYPPVHIRSDNDGYPDDTNFPDPDPNPDPNPDDAGDGDDDYGIDPESGR